jgi:hypothetical protein
MLELLFFSRAARKVLNPEFTRGELSTTANACSRLWRAFWDVDFVDVSRRRTTENVSRRRITLGV